MAKIDGVLEDKVLISNLQLSFHFRVDLSDNQLFEIISGIKNLNPTFPETKSGKSYRIFSFYFFVNNSDLENIKIGKYNEFKKQFEKIIEFIEISNELHLGSQADYQNKDTVKEINIEDLEDILSVYLKNLDIYELETLFNQSLLNNIDGFLTEDQINAISLDKRYNPIVNLISKSGISRNLKRIFHLIDDSDYMVKRIAFYYILRKNQIFTFSEIEKDYRRIKGKDPFLPEIRLELLNCIDQLDSTRLELYFRDYCRNVEIRESIKKQIKIHKDQVRIEIPLNPNAYEFEKKFNKEIEGEMRYLFRVKTDLVLKTFRRVLILETKRTLNIDLNEILLVCFQYDKANIEKLASDGLYFDNLAKLLDEKTDIELRFDERAINHYETREYFVIFKGYSQESKRKSKTEVKWERTFQIRDDKRNHLFECKIIQSKTHFKTLKLNMESEIEIQAFFKIMFNYVKASGKWIIFDKYFEIVDISILDNFKPIEVEIGRHFNGVSRLENTRDGLILFKYPTNGQVYYSKILDVPLVPLHRYKGQNATYWEIMLDKETIVKTKPDLAVYIENETTFNVVSGAKLKEAISIILNAYKKQNEMPLKNMFNTCGVFEDGKGGVILSHPFNQEIAVIGENDIQTDVIENIKARELDKKGKLTKNFFKILHINTQPENFRLGVFGYSAIHPFFYYLKKFLDVFGNLFVIGVAGSGKTTLLELMINEMYGTKMKSPDSIESAPRLTKFATETTTALNIDDIDDLEEKLMAWIKTNSTRKGTRDRLTHDNRKISEQTYTSYTGSANEKDFLSGSKNDAFRKRCLIFELHRKIELKEEITAFETEKSIIKDNKIFGYYFLEKSIEYINGLYSEKSLTFYQKFVKLIKTHRNLFKKLFLEKEIILCDIRRLTIYTLIYLGWIFWDNVFKLKKLNSKLLKEALDLENGIFLNFVKELEEAEHSISLEIIDNILEFYLQREKKFGANRTPNGEPVLQRDFINDYDEFAKKRGYDTLRSLTKLGTIQSEILNRHIKPGTVYFDKNGTMVTQYGIIFYAVEIQKLRIERDQCINEPETNQQIPNQQTLNEPKGSKEYREYKERMEKIFTPEHKFEKILSKTKEIIETNKDPVHKDGLIQVLNLDYSEAEIRDFLSIAILNEILVLKDGFFYLKNK